MSVFPIKQKWTRKPAHRVELAKTSINNKASLAFSPYALEGINLVNGSTGTWNTITDFNPSVGAAGPGIQISSGLNEGGHVEWTNCLTSADGEGYTIMAVCQVDNVTSDYRAIIDGDFAYTPRNFQLRLEQTTGYAKLIVFNTVNGTSTATTSVAPDLNKPFVVIGRLDTDGFPTVRFWQPTGAGYVYNSGFSLTGTPRGLRKEQRALNGNNNRFSGIFYHGQTWARALSDGEIQSLLYNPWQVFQPRTLYIPYSTGATPPASATPYYYYRYLLFGGGAGL